MALKMNFCGKMIKIKLMRVVVKKKEKKIMVRTKLRMRKLNNNQSFQKTL
jgi:hypothetical protein